MTYSVKADGNVCECKLTDDDVHFTSEIYTVRISVEDIIGCEVVLPFYFFRPYGLYLWYIHQEGLQLMKKSVYISGDENVCEKLKTEIQGKIKTLKKRPKSLLVLINPIGGNKTGEKDYKNIVAPIFKLAEIKCDVIVSQRQKHMVEIAGNYDFSGTDGLVILGGDGSFTEVVNVLLRMEQAKAGIDFNDPRADIRPITIPIGMIPTGTGNAVSMYSIGCKDITSAVLHVLQGNIFMRNSIGVYADNRLLDYSGLSGSYGFFSDLLYHSDTKYRWLGRLRYYVVPILMSMFSQFIRPFDAELTFYTDATETDGSKSQTSGEKEVEIEGKKLQGVKSVDKETVVIDRNLTTVMPVNGNLYNKEKQQTTWNDSFKMPGNVFSSILYDGNMTGMQYVKHLKEILNMKEKRTETFLDIVNARGVVVKVNIDRERDGSEIDMLDHSVAIDGEIYTFDKLEIQYWLKEKTVPIYTSYL